VAFAWALLVASSPFFPLLEIRLLAETFLVVFFALAAALMLRRILPGGTGIPAWLPGILLGLATLTKEITILFPLFFYGFACLTDRTTAMLKYVAAVMIVLVLVASPWIIRNASLPDGGLFLSKGTLGMNLWVGTWERNARWTYAGFPDYAFRSDEERHLVEDLNVRKDNEVMFALARDRVLEDTLGTIVTWITRLPQMWWGTRSELATTRVEEMPSARFLVKGTLFAINAVTVMLAIAGMLWCVSARKKWLIMMVPVIYFAAIYMPFHNTEPRYSLPALPFLYFFAAVFLARAAESFRRG
jgi:4-amino-4-deoxy-L-arabinose transferase-like glycosyltransferase